jgi:hypothetical protein
MLQLYSMRFVNTPWPSSLQSVVLINHKHSSLGSSSQKLDSRQTQPIFALLLIFPSPKDQPTPSKKVDAVVRFFETAFTDTSPEILPFMSARSES